MIRLSVYAHYRSGAEVLIRDSGPLYDIAGALRIITEIRAVIADHGDAIRRGEIEITVRCADRQFEADGDRPVRKPATEKRRQYGDRF